MYGRGYSEAPKLPCNANLFSVQLALLLQYVRWDAVDTIVGFSMVCNDKAIYRRTSILDANPGRCRHSGFHGHISSPRSHKRGPRGSNWTDGGMNLPRDVHWQAAFIRM